MQNDAKWCKMMQNVFWFLFPQTKENASSTCFKMQMAASDNYRLPHLQTLNSTSPSCADTGHRRKRHLTGYAILQSKQARSRPTLTAMRTSLLSAWRGAISSEPLDLSGWRPDQAGRSKTKKILKKNDFFLQVMQPRSAEVTHRLALSRSGKLWLL